MPVDDFGGRSRKQAAEGRASAGEHAVSEQSEETTGLGEFMSRSTLKELQGLKDTFGGEAGARKVRLLKTLARTRLSTKHAVLALHETLCFLRAYPDNPAVLEAVGTMLDGFDRRRDLRAFRRNLTDSGIAGTRTSYPFFCFTARWLARTWPSRIRIDWTDFEKKDALVEALPLLLPYSENIALDSADLTPRGWLHTLKSPDETDAEFLIRRFEHFPGDDFSREKAYEDLDIQLILSPGPDTPSRSRARFEGSPVSYQTLPLKRGRPDPARARRERPKTIRDASPSEARRLIELARWAMVTRSRDLDAFAHADPTDVRLIDFDEGLRFVFIGMLPERRLMLEAVYGYLTLKNGIPIGYGVLASLFNSTEVAFNTFESFRGAESAYVFTKLLAAAHSVFGSDAFTLETFQIGEDNPEALSSGAWWFYQKLGFRPASPENRRLMNRELARMKKRPGVRSDTRTLRKLSSEKLYLHTKKERSDIIGKIGLDKIGLALLRGVAENFGADREGARRECAIGAARLLGLRSLAGFSKGERLAWERWSPLVLALPGVRRWSPSARRGLVAVIRAKGGRRESEFVRLFDKHLPLRRSLLSLAV